MTAIFKGVKITIEFESIETKCDISPLTEPSNFAEINHIMNTVDTIAKQVDDIQETITNKLS